MKRSYIFIFSVFFIFSFKMVSAQLEKTIGMGMAYVILEPNKSLYFYNVDDLEMMPEDLLVNDSVSFSQGEHFTDISYAPPYFAPEYMKLDYNALLLKVITVSNFYLEVEVNTYTKQTAWIHREKVNYKPYADFFIDIYAVELIDEKINPIKIKPLENASILATPPVRFSLNVVAVKGDWLKVSTNGLADRIQPYGWVRWKKDGKLLVNYSLLS